MTIPALLANLTLVQTPIHPPILPSYQPIAHISSAPIKQTMPDTQTSQVIKIRLERSGPDDEWIRIEIVEAEESIALQVYHTTRIRRELLSDVANGVVGVLSPLPLPVGINFHEWEDHETLALTFQPDGCPQTVSPIPEQELNNCTITGIESLVLPTGTNIYTGTFKIDYAEEELIRSVTFRVPLED